MIRSRPLALVPVVCAAYLMQWSLVARAEEAKAVEQAKAESGHYMRLTRDAKKKPQALETSIVRFVPKAADQAGLEVDLISAVHIGEQSYYDELNKRFENYDVVLYELVAPEGTKIPKGGGKSGGSLLSSVQNGMKDMLELEFQLAEIDYTKANFVHADLTPDQFSKSMSDKGESFWTMFSRLMTASMAQQAANPNPSGDIDLLMAMFGRNRALKLKRVMAEQFTTNVDLLTGALEGPDGSTLITERNKAALAVLKKEIGAGRKKIAIFYGGGHMPDFHKRLEAEFNLKPSQTEWVEAWDLRDK